MLIEGQYEDLADSLDVHFNRLQHDIKVKRGQNACSLFLLQLRPPLQAQGFRQLLPGAACHPHPLCRRVVQGFDAVYIFKLFSACGKPRHQWHCLPEPGSTKALRVPPRPARRLPRQGGVKTGPICECVFFWVVFRSLANLRLVFGICCANTAFHQI